MLTSGPMALAMDDITTWRPEKKNMKRKPNSWHYWKSIPLELYTF